MRKLSLKLEDIRVTGFEVLPPERKVVGTVHGAESLTRYTRCDWETCWESCKLGCTPAC